MMKRARRTWLLPSVAGATLLSIACYADVRMDIKREQIAAKTPEELVELVLDQEQPIWKFSGQRLVSENGVQSEQAMLVYRPFRSSAAFCRTYATTIRKPGWVCDGDCEAGATAGFDVSSKAFLAITENEDTQCQSLDFDRDYFALERDLHDDEVAELLAQFRKNLARWKSDKSADKRFADLLQLSERHLISLDVLPRGDEIVIRFMLRHPRFETHQVVFDLMMKEREVVSYEVSERMP